MEEKRTVRYFSLIQFLLYASTTLYSYCVIYFRNLGFSSQRIGYITAAGMLVSMLVLPAMGVLADKLRAPRKILLVALLFLTVDKALLPLAGEGLQAPFWPVLIISVVILAGNRVVISMVDSWAGGQMELLHREYGVIRRFGSLGGIATTLLAGLLIGSVLPDWFCGVQMVLFSVPMIAAVALFGARHTRPTVKREQKADARELLSCVLGNKRFLVYLLLSLAFYMFFSTVDLDMSYVLEAVGADKSRTGLLSSVRAAWEIVLMVLLPRWKKQPPRWALLAVAGVFVAAEHLLYPLCTSFPALLACTFFTGVGGGIFYGVGTSYVLQIVDPKAATTAVSLLAALLSLVAVVCAVVSGAVIDRFGVLTLTSAIGALSLVLSLLYALGSFLLERRERAAVACERQE